MANPLLESLSDQIKYGTGPLGPFSCDELRGMDPVPEKGRPLVGDHSCQRGHIRTSLWLQIQTIFLSSSKS